MMGRVVTCAVVLLVLAGCQTTSVEGDVPTIEQSEDARPGALMVSPARAGQVFSDLCVAPAPTFEATEAAAAQNGLVDNPRLETYFHPSENISVKLEDGACSMVFASDADQADVESAMVQSLSVATAPNLAADIRLRVWPYYSAVIGPN